MTIQYLIASMRNKEEKEKKKKKKNVNKNPDYTQSNNAPITTGDGYDLKTDESFDISNF